METSNTSRSSRVASWQAPTGSPASKVWNSSPFAHWSEANSDAQLLYRDTGELPNCSDDAADLLHWLACNGGREHIEAFMAVDSERSPEERVIRHFCFDCARFDPQCMALLAQCPSLTKIELCKGRSTTADDDMGIARMVCSHPPLRSLTLDSHHWDEAALATLAQGLEEGRIPGLTELRVTYCGSEDGEWMSRLGRYLEASPVDLQSIELNFVRPPWQGLADSRLKASELLESLSKGSTLEPRTLKIYVGSSIQLGEGAVSVRESLARFIPERCANLETLDLCGVSELIDWSCLSQLTKLKNLDISMESVWRWGRFPSPNNRNVLKLMGECGNLESLTARGRSFHPSKDADNPTPAELGAAVEGTRLEKLYLDGCDFSPEQMAEILEAIPRNRSLTEVRLPMSLCTSDQRRAIDATLERNKMDLRLGEAARGSLARVFAGVQLPDEIAATIADFALEGLHGSNYNAAARTMIGVGKTV